jgi:hypothetical protein
MEVAKMKRVALVFVLSLVPSLAFGGPPFRTDDPVPVDHRHSEFYLFSSGTRRSSGTSGIGPAVEYNYGILPDAHAHFIFPAAYNNPNGEPSHIGYGDTEVGLKYRLYKQKEGNDIPTIGTFPIVEIPTGNDGKGLGNGRAQVLLPLWLQKDMVNWSTYGGGGYWINPGPGNRNYWTSGIQLQYSFSEVFYLGAEIFHQTASREDGHSGSGFNFGGGIPLQGKFQLLFSAGRGVTDVSENLFSYYVGLYCSF